MRVWDVQRIFLSSLDHNFVMGIKDIFNSVETGVTKAKGTLSDMFGPMHYTQAPVAPVSKVINPERISEALRQLESSGGTHPYTPRNQNRQFIVPAMNANEQPRTVNYNSGYGGEYGLTPLALAELAKSDIDKSAATSTYTKFGPPLIPGMDVKKIQQELLSPQGSGRLAQEYFMRKRSSKDDWTPEALTKDYIENYVGKGSVGDTPANRKRALEYFTSIAE